MMQNEQNKWVDKVMGSLQGMRAAEPPADLFETIEARIGGAGAKVISLQQMRWGIAIAVVLLLFNFIAIRSYTVNNNDGYAYTESYEGSQLVSDYKIYE